MFLTYIALVHKAHKCSAPYGVIFPDFPGCVSAGSTMEEALQKAREGLLFHMEGLLEAGECLPKPTRLEDIMKRAENKVATPCLLHIVPPTGHVKRVNISMDNGLLVEIDQAAKQQGKNRSEFLADAARQMLA